MSEELIKEAVSMAIAGTKRICAEEYEAAMAKMTAEMARIAQDRITALIAAGDRLDRFTGHKEYCSGYGDDCSCGYVDTLKAWREVSGHE